LGICCSKPVVGLEYLAGLFYCTDRESAEGGQIISGELRVRLTSMIWFGQGKIL
jgi:hypothetical protein